MHYSRAAHRSHLVVVGVLVAIVLVLTARSQIYDTNFYVLGEATSVLAGDHPYRDFFEWGAPLAVYLSAAMQLLVGYRLIGEFILQWSFIVAGCVLSFHLGLRLSRSIAASSAVLAIVLLVIAYTPTYHYSKLVVFPAAVWLAWRYIDRPGVVSGATFGVLTAVAFLFRHDYGLYVGFAAVAAFGLARVSAPESRPVGRSLADIGAYVGALALVLAPWLVVVQTSEGIVEYVRLRVVLFERPSAGLVYALLFTENPIDAVRSWVTEPASPRAAEYGALWLRQLALLIPVVLLGAAALDAWRRRRGASVVPVDTWRMALAGAFLAVVASALFREPPYVVVTVPLTAALASRFLTGTGALRRVCAVGVLTFSTVAALAWTQESRLFRPGNLPTSVPRAFRLLVSSPPIPAESNGPPSMLLQYLRDCTAAGDRLLVTGSTPYQVAYYARRPIAGGHYYWRLGWRRDDVHERQSLQLLERQSVPFAVATTDPVLNDFEAYPRIREYLVQHYVELEGTAGRVLVDRRRQPTATFGPDHWPCFA